MFRNFRVNDYKKVIPTQFCKLFLVNLVSGSGENEKFRAND